MDIDWWEIWDSLYRMAIAFGLALPMAIDREVKARSAGIRTFPLVAVASCAFMLVAVREFSASDAQARVMYGIITGIGFIGGGAILKTHGTVSGTATAASIWSTGAIGLSVAQSRYEIAITLAILNYVTLVVGRTFKREIDGTDQDDQEAKEDDQ